MKKIMKLTESDLQRIVGRVIEEGNMDVARRKKKEAMDMLKKISIHLRNYDVEDEFASADMIYLINMFEKIADNQDIKL
jgi:hypothetical protein